MQTFDMIVIGSGRWQRLRFRRRSLAGASRDRKSRVWGTSVNTGTIPSKTMRERAASFGLQLQDIYGSNYA